LAPPSVIQERVLEQQGRTTAGTLHHPVRYLGDLQPGAYRLGHPDQLADPVDRLDKLPEIIDRHRTSSRTK
jgi:hypothetical protein